MKYLIIIFTLFSISGCSKAKSKRWLVAEIHVTDAYTGESIPCQFTLTYSTTSMFGSHSDEVSLGNSDSDGIMKIEREVSGKQSGFKVHIYNYSNNYGLYPHAYPMKSISLSTKSENIKNVELNSNSFYSLWIKNANCAGPEDSIFVRMSVGSGNWTSSWPLAGCVDTIPLNNMGYTMLSFEPSVNIRYTVKRGTQIDSFSVVHQLVPKEIVPIEIIY